MIPSWVPSHSSGPVLCGLTLWKAQPSSRGTTYRTLVTPGTETLRTGDVPLHTHQFAIIEEGEPDGLEVKADLMLSWRLGGEGEAAPRAILTGQQILATNHLALFPTPHPMVNSSQDRPLGYTCTLQPSWILK